MVWDSITSDGSENRILYQSGGVLDPVSQEHYADFARSWVFTGATAPPPDITAPTPPVIRDVAGDDKGVTINWAASTDDVAVESYDVFRDDQFLGTTSLTSLVDANVYAGMTYSYTVRATDTSQNKSQFSQPRAISVADATPPTVPGTPTGVVNAEDTVTLSWAASTDNVGVSSYQLWRDGQLLATTANTTYVDGTTRQGGTYRYTLYAVDAAGNRSTASTATSVTVPDKLAPTAPTSLVGTSPAKRTVRLTWTASTDNVDVTGYYVYRDTTRIATLSGQATAYTVNSLTSGRTYNFHVRAFDAARLVSPSSNVASVRVR
jgi:fibronectin type 3 domain-containing protein